MKTSFHKNIGNYAKINLTGIHGKYIVFDNDWFENCTKVYHDFDFISIDCAAPFQFLCC